MPKILIALPDSNKKIRRAATSEIKMKALIKKRAEKYGELDWTVYTFDNVMTLPHVVALINGTSKKLAKVAHTVDGFEVNLDTNRIKKTSVK